MVLRPFFSEFLLLLLLLSHFSRVRLCATPQTAAHWAPPSLGFSRQEHWSGLPFPSPMHESEKSKWKVKVKSQSEVAQSCPTLSDPMDCSLPGSSVHGIFKWQKQGLSISLSLLMRYGAQIMVAIKYLCCKQFTKKPIKTMVTLYLGKAI